MGTDTVHDDLDRLAVDGDAVAAGTDLGDGEPVAASAVAEVDRAHRARARQRPPAPGERIEPRAVGRRLGLG